MKSVGQFRVYLVREWIVWTVDSSIGLLLAEDLLVALSPPDVLGVSVGVAVLDEVYDEETDYYRLEVPKERSAFTKLNIVIAEVVDTIEASIEDLSSSLECVEGDIETVPSTEHHQVPHLTAVRSCIVIERELIRGKAGFIVC